MKVQGTNLFVMDPADGDVVDVGCVTSITGIDETIEELETTCLRDLSRTYESGLSTPGTATFTIQFDPQNPVHVQLLEWKKLGKSLAWVVGFRQESAIENGTDPEKALSTSTSDGYIFDLDDQRDWLVFEGFMNSYPFEFQPNSLVEANIGVKISGAIEIVPAGSSSS